MYEIKEYRYGKGKKDQAKKTIRSNEEKAPKYKSL